MCALTWLFDSYIVCEITSKNPLVCLSILSVQKFNIKRPSKTRLAFYCRIFATLYFVHWIFFGLWSLFILLWRLSNFKYTACNLSGKTTNHLQTYPIHLAFVASLTICVHHYTHLILSVWGNQVIYLRSGISSLNN